MARACVAARRRARSLAPSEALRSCQRSTSCAGRRATAKWASRVSPASRRSRRRSAAQGSSVQPSEPDKRARGSAFAALKARAIRLPRHFPAQRQRGEGVGTAPRPARPARKDERALRRARGGNEKILKGGVRPAIVAGAEGHGEGKRQFHFPRRWRAVFQARLEKKRAILGRERRGEGDVHAGKSAFVLRPSGVKARAALKEIRFVPAARRAGEEAESAALVQQIAEATVGQHALAGVERAAARGEQRRRSRAEEQMRVHESIFRPPRARDAIFGAARPFGARAPRAAGAVSRGPKAFPPAAARGREPRGCFQSSARSRRPPARWPAPPAPCPDDAPYSF